MNKLMIAKELITIAKELASAEREAAANDLGGVLDLIPEMEKKRAERAKKEEEYRQETNRMYAEEMKEINEKSAALIEDLKEAIVGYFNKNGMGVRNADFGHGFSREVFIGNGDSIKRNESKVVISLSVGIGDRRSPKDAAYFFLRNETLDDIRLVLSETNTVKNMIKAIEKADKDGFWSQGKEV